MQVVANQRPFGLNMTVVTGDSSRQAGSQGASSGPSASQRQRHSWPESAPKATHCPSGLAASARIGPSAVHRYHAADDWRGRVDLPQAQRAVASGADQTTAVRREREAGNRAVVPDEIVYGGTRVGRHQIVQADQPIGVADGEPAPVGRVGRGHHFRRVAVQRQACGGAKLLAHAVDRAEQPDRVVGLQRRRMNGEQQAALRARRRVAGMAGDLLDLWSFAPRRRALIRARSFRCGSARASFACLSDSCFQPAGDAPAKNKATDDAAASEPRASRRVLSFRRLSASSRSTLAWMKARSSESVA